LEDRLSASTGGNIPTEGSPADIEEELRARLRGARLVYGDAGLDEDTVERTRQAVVAIAAQGRDVASALERHYPATLVTFLVGEGVYRYQHSYWPNLSVPGLDGGTIGLAFERCLAKLDLELFDKLSDEPILRFVTPILAHGGIPRFSARDLFVLLISELRRYATADAADLVGMWKTRPAAFQGIDRPVRRFLLYGGATALDFLGRCLDLIREPDEMNSDVGLPLYIVEAYRQYLEQVPSARLHRGRSLPPPRILLDPWDQTGPIVELPTLPSDLGAASWRVNDGSAREYRGSTVEGRTVAVSPARTWEIDLIYPGGQRRSTFEALASGVLCFDPRNGAYLQTSRPVALDDVWLVTPADALVDVTDGAGHSLALQLRERLTLSAQWVGFAAAHYELAGVRAIQVLHQPVGGDLSEAMVRVVAPTERPALIGTPVAHASAENGVDVYDTVPAIQVPRLPGYADERWSVQVRTALGTQHCALADIGAAGVPVPLRALISDDFLGLVDLRVRGPLGLDLRSTFGVVPGLRVTVPDTLILPGTDREVVVRAFGGPGVSIGDGAPGREITLAVPQDANQVSAIAHRGDAALGFVVRVAKLVWAVQRLGASTALDAVPVTLEIDVLRSPETSGLLISTWQPDTTVRLALMGSDGELMSTEPALTSKREGRWRFPLALFGDTVAAQDEATLQLLLYVQGEVVVVGRVVSRVEASAFGVARKVDGSVHLTFNEARPLRDRVAHLWSLDRPWEPPIATELADGTSGVAVFAGLDVLDGPYRAQIAIADRWASPRRPSAGHPSTDDICVGARIRIGLTDAPEAPALLLLEWTLATGSRPDSLKDAVIEAVLPETLTAVYALVADTPPGSVPASFKVAAELLFENIRPAAALITQSLLDARVEPSTTLALLAMALPQMPSDGLDEPSLRGLWRVCPAMAAHFDVRLARAGDHDAVLRCEELLDWTPSSGLPLAGAGLERFWSDMPRAQLTLIRDVIALIPKQQLSIDAYVLSAFEWLLAAKDGPHVAAWWSRYKWLVDEAGRMAPEAQHYLRARRPSAGSPAWAALPVATLVAALLAATDDQQAEEARAALRDAIPFAQRVVVYDLCLAPVLLGATPDERPRTVEKPAAPESPPPINATPHEFNEHPTLLEPAPTRRTSTSALLSRLKDWRVRIQKRRTFSIFRDSELVALAEMRPSSRDDLSAILSPDKVDQHGDELLAMLAQ